MPQLKDGIDFVTGNVLSFQQMNRIKNNWYSGATPPDNPVNGMVWVKNDGVTYVYFGAAWVALGAFHLVTKEPTGFENRIDSTLSWGGTRTLTISPSNGSFDFYQEGIKYTKSSPENIQIEDTSGVHYIYYDAGTLTVSVNPSNATLDTIYETKPLLALIYWNKTDGVAYMLGDERHGLTMDGVTHRLMHNTEGALWGSGLTLSGYILNTGSDAALNFEVTDGEFFDQDITIAISDGSAANQYEQQLSGGDAVVPILYRSGDPGHWKEDAASTLPYKTGGTGRLAYNSLAGSTWGQTEVTDNKFMSITLVATHDWLYPIKMIQGQNEYTDKKTAVEEALSEILSFGNLPSPEMSFIYRLVMQTKDTFGGTKKAKIVDVTDLRGSLVTGSTAVAVDHGVLSGLADDDHGQYILHSLAGAANDFLVASGDDVFVKKTLAETGAILEGDIEHDNLQSVHANPYKLDDLATPDDNTDLDFSTTLHGLVPKGTDVGDFLKDDGTWAAAGGGGGVSKTTGTWEKSIGGGGDYSDWADMIAAMPDMIAHAVTVTIEAGTTLTETCNIRNKHGLTKNAVITIQAEKYFPTSGAIPTADSATATTLRDAALATAALGNDYFNDCWILIVDGTGTDNGFILITDYIDATGDVVVAAWTGTEPDNTSRYLIYGALVDGGSARANALVINNNTLPIYFYGIGVKDTTDIGVNTNFDTYFEARYCGVYNAGEEGIHLRNITFGYLRYCGFVKNGNRGVEASGCDNVQIYNNGISDNVVDGIGIRQGSFATMSNNFGDNNGTWGTILLQKSHAEFIGTECSGSSGNHVYADGEFKDVEVTGTEIKPGQPSFFAYNLSRDNSVTGDGTAYTVIFDPEVFDQGSDFAGHTTFTAPVDGRYLFAAEVLVADTGGTTVKLTLETSNQTIALARINASARAGGNYLSVGGSAVVDMDAGDTAHIILSVDGTGKTVDVFGDATGYTYFSGALIC